MRGFFTRSGRRLAADDGTTAIEFALVAPVLLLMLMGTIEFGIIFFANILMEGATANSARYGKTGAAETGVSREQSILNALHAHAGIVLDTARIAIQTKTYGSFDQIGQAEPFYDANGNLVYDSGENYDDINGNGERDEEMGIDGPGDANDVVVYEVSYPWHVATPIIRTLIADKDGNLMLTARVVVKNEPYATLAPF